MFNLNLKERIKNVGRKNVEYAGKIVGVQAIKETTGWVVQLAKVAFIPKKSTRVESFNQAQARLMVTNEDIAHTKNMFTLSFYVSLLFALFCFGGAIHYFIDGATIGIFTMIAIMLVCLSNSFKFSFRVYQINHRSLCSAREWFAAKKEWFPKI
ncbi:hypothetical protein [Massilia sp. WG5]|jgi:hypothetical protein|uniref:hypothetical protein n=1 Tax=Massilia sp. WG5 TaxID=1707785 RepID=UPI000705D919|nr:hypothetical protein [Massilia sp. WG5]ALK96612.1 hypothetical protein AM586_10345 [Massilia sp. WG5]